MLKKLDVTGLNAADVLKTELFRSVHLKVAIIRTVSLRYYHFTGNEKRSHQRI